MNRKITFLLALIMVLNLVPFASFAEQNYDKQLKDAIIKSKKLFNIGEEYDKFEHSVTSREGMTYFYLTWSDSKDKLGSIDVSITSDGTVVSYGKWEPSYGEQKTKLPKVSKEEGLKIAKDFIKKVSPEFADNIKYINRLEPLNLYSNGYNYYLVRTEKGIPYYNNNIDIYVDNSTGEVRNYYATWDTNIVFPEVKDPISLEKAQQLYKDKIGLDLLYKLSYAGDKPKLYLAYGPLNANQGIDAKDGQVVILTDYYNIYDRVTGAGGGGYKEANEEESLSPGEEEAIKDVIGLISQEEAEKIGRDILKLDSEYKLGYISLSKNWRYDNTYQWQMDFIKESQSSSDYASISIDAKTKELIYFYRNTPSQEGKKVKYDEKQSLDIAKEYIKKMSPDKLEKMELRTRPEGENHLAGENSYYFEFIRKIDDAYVEEDGIYIQVNAIDGEIVEYRLNWNKGDFPSKENVIPIEKAYEVLFKDIGMELKYIVPGEYDGGSNKKQEAKLVYGLKSEKPANIDANTGDILNYLGEPFKSSNVVSYNDIDKSYAKEKINILAQYGIALPGEEFKPKEKITQRDFLYLLAKANSPYFEIDGSKDKLYSYLINLGIVKEEEKNPEGMVTKEEGIKYVIRALKYDKIADVSEIYKDLFKDTKDIDPKLKGYAAIAYGLNIVEGSNGYLKPKAELKREDAANMIYNYLFSGN